MTPAKKALVLSLVQPGPAPTRAKSIETFRPEHTYSIFEDDQIYGYQGLVVHLRFNASDMRPNLEVKAAKKLETEDEAAVHDVEEILKEYLPEGMQPLSLNG